MSDKQKKELYLKVPYHILNIKDLSPAEKFLLAHIYSFGENGCWQSNKTLAEMFMTSKRTIQIWLASLEKYISIQNPKGYYRTIWAKSHPDFLQRGAKDCADVRKKVYSDCAKSFVSLRKNLRPTNINTIKENNKRTTATPSPPPCKGAPALLAERENKADEKVQHFSRNFGKEKKKWQPMSQEEFEACRQSQIRALYAVRTKGTAGPDPGTTENRRWMMDDPPTLKLRSAKRKRRTKNNEQ